MPSASNTTTNRYGAIAAEIYDLDKPVGPFPDTAFYLERLASIPGPILEPACGSGRTLLPLLEAGRDAAGFDASPDMLERCRALCGDRGYAPDLSLQRFETFDYKTKFAAIVVPAASFTLLHDFAVALEVLRRFHAHLAPGGVLIVDIEPLRALSASGTDRRSWSAANGDLLTLEGQRVSVDWIAQRVSNHLRYERWRDNRLIASELEPMSQRYWGVEEFAMALAATGFAEIGVVGGYDRRRSPRAGDRMLTFEATKA